MQVHNFEDILQEPEGFDASVTFLHKAMGRPSRKGKPASKDQREKIRSLIEACGQCRYSRNYDAVDRIKALYQTDFSGADDPMTARDADKLIIVLLLLMHEIMSRTIALSRASKAASKPQEEEIETQA